MKHCLECLFLFNQNKNKGVNGEVKSSKSMLIKSCLTPESHMEVGWPGTQGVELLTPKPR